MNSEYFAFLPSKKLLSLQVLLLITDGKLGKKGRHVNGQLNKRIEYQNWKIVFFCIAKEFQEIQKAIQGKCFRSKSYWTHKTRVEFIFSSLYSYISCILCFHIWYSGIGRSVVGRLGGCNICHPFLQPIAFTRQLEMWIVRYKSAGKSLHLVEYRP